MMLRKVNSVLELVGNTPLVRINRMNPVPGVEVLAKLEVLNPGGSVKDRIALRMIEQAEATGQLTPGKIVLEASSGNTAIGLAMVCAVKGYPLLVAMSESASEERKRILKAYGAQILLTPGYRGTDGAIEEAYRLAREEPEKYVLVDQFNNEANWQAHYEGTGREIWEATEGQRERRRARDGDHGNADGHHPCLEAVQPGDPRGRRRALQGAQDPGPEEHEGELSAGDLPARGVRRDRQRRRRFGLRGGPPAGAGRGDFRGDERRGGHESRPGRGAGLGPRHRRRPAARRRRALSFHLAVRLRDHARAVAILQHAERHAWSNSNPCRRARSRMYSCGPSLDGPPDLGLCRRLVFADVLRRYLERRGYQVKHAMNLGDIDDRTVKECLKSGEKLRDFTERWEKVFFESLAILRVKRAQHYPKASEHVNEMVEQTRSLLEKGLAYEKLRSVYFRISSFSDYGRLSGIAPDRMRREASTTYDYYDKDNPGDFALFKRPTLAELKAGIFWQTPWGNARPGWHVECACMAVRCLGQPIDIHTASTDLTFPHGDNEIAIACGLSTSPWPSCGCTPKWSWPRERKSAARPATS